MDCYLVNIHCLLEAFGGTRILKPWHQTNRWCHNSCLFIEKGGGCFSPIDHKLFHFCDFFYIRPIIIIAVMKYFGQKTALPKYLESFEKCSNEIHIKRGSPIVVC